MAPSATDTTSQIVDSVKGKIAQTPENTPAAVGATKLDGEPELHRGHKDPLKPSGLLDRYKQFDVTPVIGLEFVDADLAEWLRAPNSDDLIRELAITSAHIKGL